MNVKEYIESRYPPDHPLAGYYIDLWQSFERSGLADRHFVRELTSGEDGKFEQRVWEMVLARRLSAEGHALVSADQGPDFGIGYRGRQVWVEAIVPSPVDVPADWLAVPEPGKPQVGNVPFDAILLRWTAAFKEKSEKLLHPVRGYRTKGIVAANDAYVIAIDPTRLTFMPLDEGNSRLPFAIETVFPVGPWAIPIDRVDYRAGPAFRTARYSIHNRNQAEIQTYPFLNPDFSGVSAIASCSTYWSPAETIGITVVHNPLADNPLAPGLFGDRAVEYVAEPINEEEYEVRQLGELPQGN